GARRDREESRQVGDQFIASRAADAPVADQPVVGHSEHLPVDRIPANGRVTREVVRRGHRVRPVQGQSATAVASQRREHGHEHLAACCGKARRLVAHPDGADQVGLRIDPHDAATTVRRPHRAVRVGDCGRGAAHLDLLHSAGHRIQADHGTGRIAGPDAARADRYTVWRDADPESAGDAIATRADQQQPTSLAADNPNPPTPAATPAGTLPSGMVAVTMPLPGSILDTVAPVTLAAQTDPYPYASAIGPLPTPIVATTVPVRGLTSDTVLSNSFATHISPAPATP